MATANEPPGGYAEIANPPCNNAVKIPTLGFGTYQIPPGHETEQAVSAALKVGYRHIDTAAVYENEESVGKSLFSPEEWPLASRCSSSIIWSSFWTADNKATKSTHDHEEFAHRCQSSIPLAFPSETAAFYDSQMKERSPGLCMRILLRAPPTCPHSLLPFVSSKSMHANLEFITRFVRTPLDSPNGQESGRSRKAGNLSVSNRERQCQLESATTAQPEIEEGARTG